jgi:hypothetical protein
MRYLSITAVLLAALLATACGKDERQRTTSGGSPGEELPAPAGTRGGVTGMPDRPGPGPVGPPVAEQPEVLLDENGNPLLPDAAPGEAGAAMEPTADDAVNVIREYYSAINSGDFGRAYALWSDGGSASGQSMQQFATGFANTTGVSVDMQPPLDVDAAAGSRYIQVPVSVVATQRDGSQLRFVGSYTLRRSVVDGATPEQRAWRIGSADLRQAQP